MHKAVNSSKKHDWRTPKALLDKVRQMGPITLDPCASDDRAHHFASVNLTKSNNGLTADWGEHVGLIHRGRAFVNSEYGEALPRWVKKCATEWNGDIEVIQLTPNRPGVEWYRSAMAAASAMCSLDGRLIFEGGNGDPAPFPSALFYYGDRPYLFCHVFDGDGDVRLLP